MVDTEKNSSDALESCLDFCSSSLLATHIVEFRKEVKYKRIGNYFNINKGAFEAVVECAGFCNKG